MTGMQDENEIYDSRVRQYETLIMGISDRPDIVQALLRLCVCGDRSEYKIKPPMCNCSGSSSHD